MYRTNSKLDYLLSEFNRDCQVKIKTGRTHRLVHEDATQGIDKGHHYERKIRLYKLCYQGELIEACYLSIYQ